MQTFLLLTKYMLSFKIFYIHIFLYKTFVNNCKIIDYVYFLYF